MDNIKVSICCVTYNHEKYLREALDGILMQKVNFEYEVIIGDDHSADASQDIIRSYQDKFGKRMIAFLGDKNIGANDNYARVQSCSRGEYVVVLETDDKWTDQYKLQKQVDYLDAHPEAVAVAHRCQVIDQNSNRIDIVYPDCKNKKYTLRHFRKWIMPGQTTSIMYRNYHTRDIGVDKDFIYRCSELGPGDRSKIFSLLSVGAIHCLPDVLSEYRLVRYSGNSFSATNKLKYKDYADYWKCFVTFSEEKRLPKSFVDTAYAMYMEAMLASCFIQHDISMKEIKKVLKIHKNWVKIFGYILGHINRVMFNCVKGFFNGKEYL